MLGTAVGETLGATLGWVLGDKVGTGVGEQLGVALGLIVGMELGTSVGATDGATLGTVVGATDGVTLGTTVGTRDGFMLGDVVGFADGVALGVAVGECALSNIPLTAPDSTPSAKSVKNKAVDPSTYQSPWALTGTCRAIPPLIKPDSALPVPAMVFTRPENALITLIT